MTGPRALCLGRPHFWLPEVPLDNTKKRTAASILAAILLNEVESLYSALAAFAPNEESRDAIVERWSVARDAYKPVLEEIARKGR